ncbi:MAG TPA: RNA 2'-phosphotransferase, partial [Bacteroidia bacterium]|nr:RNA 2'-phosphotransferase [Bacteroidia bacterium]
QVDLDYEPVLPPEILYHGTVGRYSNIIAKEGIKKMSRHHVHMSKDLQTAIIVGTRRGEAVILKIKAGEMHRDGYAFFMSPNGVWLTEFVPPEYVVFP